MLKGLGFAAAASAGAGLISDARAQSVEDVPQLDISSGDLELKLADRAALDYLRLNQAVVGRLPYDTPIENMGLTEEAKAGLTEGAKRLTKGDLVGLQQSLVTDTAAEMTVTDILSVRDAFAVGYRLPATDLATGPQALDISCCCCTPCCCAAAVEVEASAD